MQAADMEVMFAIQELTLVVSGVPEIRYSLRFDMQGLSSKIKLQNDSQDITIDFSVDSIQITDDDHC